MDTTVRRNRTLMGIALAQLVSGLAVMGFAAFLLVATVEGQARPVSLVAIGILGLATAVLGLALASVARRPRPVEGEPPGAAVSAAPPPGMPRAKPREAEAALMLLSLLQEKGRFLDFVMEDIAAHTDEQVSAATRVVHQGCAEVVREAFNPRPVCRKARSETVTLEKGFSAEDYRLVGNIRGEPPYQGILLHRGWRAQKVKLPRRTRPPEEPQSPVIVPAEVEM